MTSSVSELQNTLARARELQPKLVEFRRHIHSNPELSFQEEKTAAYAAEILSGLGYRVQRGVGGTGVVAEIGQGRTVILRADMDALPIEESNDAPYKSQQQGVMHACGHDVHVACALGAATLIAQSPPANGRIRFLLQPAEEMVNADGKSGAPLMIEQGATADAEAIFGLHVDPRTPCGQIAVDEGPVLAACDTFDIVIKGKGCHGAYPEFGVDAVVLASHVVQAMQTIISRRKSALDPAVLTIGGIKSNTYRPNIVAAEVEITGTLRYFSTSMQSLAQKEIKKACQIAETLGGSYSLRYNSDNPALNNDPQLTNLVRYVAKQMLGADSVINSGKGMGAEDFSFLSAELPGCFFFLGTALEDRSCTIHTPDFDVNEDAIPIGSAVLAESAMRYLSS